jgi:hypothetical protein
MSRLRLPNRRKHTVAEIEHGGFRLTVGVGRYSNGQLGEVFIDTNKGNTTIDTILKDSAVLLSLALQFGADGRISARRSRAPARSAGCSTRSRARHDPACGHRQGPRTAVARR